MVLGLAHQPVRHHGRRHDPDAARAWHHSRPDPDPREWGQGVVQRRTGRSWRSGWSPPAWVASRVRLGHELNGSWYRWSAQKDPASYAAYWRQIVTTMRSVAGAKFAFDWNVAVGTDSWDATLAWPGDSYVDTVGQDVYDQKWGDASATPAVRWNALVNGAGKFHQGMTFWASFAAAHGKPVSFAEWALVAAGASMANGGEGKDDPYYIQKMHDWFASHPTAFEIYFDRTASDGDHVLNGGKFPQAAALYKDLFSKPSTTPSPTARPRLVLSDRHVRHDAHAPTVSATPTVDRSLTTVSASAGPPPTASGTTSASGARGLRLRRPPRRRPIRRRPIRRTSVVVRPGSLGPDRPPARRRRTRPPRTRRPRVRRRLTPRPP